MKKLLLLCLVCLGIATGARAFVYETGYELQAQGDFDGDGRQDLVIVDVATGNYRIAYQTGAGTFTWTSARASGISGATGLGIGRLNSLAYDSLAFTGPEANRINIVDATNPGAAGEPASSFIPSVGLNGLAVTEIGGAGNTTHSDLYVASAWNGSPAHHQTLLRNNATTNRTVLSDTSISFLRERLNPIQLHTNLPVRLALFQRGANPTFDSFTVVDLVSGAPVTVTAVATGLIPRPYEFLAGQFVRTNPYTQVLFYAPTGNFLYEYQFIEPTPGAFAIAFTNQFFFTNRVRQIFSLPGTNDTKLLVIYTNETSAAVFNFNGLTAPVVVQQFNADEGEHFTGAGILPNSGFMAYSAPIGENTSQKFRQFNWTGSGYTNVASGDLPRANKFTAAANVLQFRFEPFVTNAPNLVRLNAAGDWSSAPTIAASISVRTETFLNSTQGLVNPTPTVVGPLHPLAAYGLANQYSNMISLFSFSPPAGDRVSDVSISPSPGTYPTAVKISFTAVTPTDTVFYRIGSGAWAAWAATPVVLFSNAVVQYYGQPAGNAAKSAIKSAAFAFTQNAGQMDSDRDGVPDFVEVAKGLDPLGGSDSDGDGYSDLEELLRNHDPLNASSVPTNFPHLDAQAAFDMAVTPLPWDGFSNRLTLAATGTVLRAYNFQGSLYGLASATNTIRPVARLTNLVVVPEDRLLTRATELHYDIRTTNSDRTVGREMIGVSPLPPLNLPVISYSYGGSNLLTEATNWIRGASNQLTGLPRALVTNSLSVLHTLEALLLEQKVAQLLGARGSNWWTNLTLFPFRVSDLGRTNPAQATLLSLENAAGTQPAYRLETIFISISNSVQNSLSAPVANLRTLTREIYGLNSRLNNTNPATFASPVDALRRFLWSGRLDSNYLFWSTNSGITLSASNGAQSILAAIPARATTNVLLQVRADTMGPCRILDRVGGGATFSLQDAAGLPFSFPDNFTMLPGSQVQIAGYSDVTNAECAYPAIEVTSALLCGVPLASDLDNDGNLLLDTWEKQFFGYVGLANPFGDDDADGFRNVQEMLEGSDPKDVHGIPLVSAAPFAAPALNYHEAGGFSEIYFEWPAAYIGHFNFGVRHTGAIGDPFVALPVSAPIPQGGNLFKLTFSPPGTPQHFYFMTVGLR